MTRVVSLIGLFLAITVSAQQMATMKAPKKVSQGSNIIFQITTDKPANVEGSIGMEISPMDGGKLIPSSTFSLGIGRNVSIAVLIPIDAKPGKWKITRVYFRSYSGDILRDLTPKGDLTFDVTPNQSVDLPSEANVEIR